MIRVSDTVQQQEQKIQRQIELERQFKTEAIDRARKATLAAIQNGRASELGAIQKLIHAAHETTANAIQALKDKRITGLRAKYRAYLREVDTDILTVVTLTKLFDSLASHDLRQCSIQTLSVTLARHVRSEIIAKKVEQTAPAYMNRVYEHLKESQTRSASHLLRTYRAAAANVHLEFEDWDIQTEAAIGKMLLECAWETGLFRWDSKPGKMIYLMANPEFDDVLTDIVTSSEGMAYLPPMIVPPVQHEDIFNGGYITDLSHRDTYKNRQLNRKMRREVNEAFKAATGIKQALNKAQEVPYLVNPTILKYIQEAKGIGFCIGMPSHHQRPKPEFTLPEDKTLWGDKENEEFELWKSRTRAWYGDERRRLSRIRQLAITLELAQRFVDEEALYFPTCVDWRYRLYFKSSLHPQGTDIQKALLHFGVAKPLGERGLFWLKAHIATCFGFDKGLMEHRVAWTDERIDALRAFARDPFNQPDFAEADSFWCLLAACIELDAALSLPDPTQFESRIPVAVDATNSGGQHFSAILRDPVGGKLTNLFWDGNDVKADLYMDVKRRTEAKVQSGLSDADTVVQADWWMQNPITRTMTKRPTMTYFYSATMRSCIDYTMLGAIDEGYQGTEEYSLFKLCCYLAPLMRSSIDEAMPAAAGGMAYLASLARACPKEEHLQWKTPLGGLVINRYAENEDRRVRVRSMGIEYVLYRERNHNICDKRKAMSGIAPNFIHSCDSTHLMMVVNAFDGHILPIHDSLATHACDMDKLNVVIREQFVKLNTDWDLLEIVREAAEAAGADTSDIPRPVKGTLDINMVNDSPFFFC